MVDLNLAAYSRIVILTGAGISVASGIRPFRGPNGVWNEISADQLNADAGQNNPSFIWQTLGAMREVVASAIPNAAHQALADLEQNWNSSQHFTLITQNIDGLHQRAGSQNVVELHGSLLETRCSNAACDAPVFADQATHIDQIPQCSICHAHQLPNVVLFEKPMPLDASWHSKKVLRDCDLFLAIGTSGTVQPAASFVRSADYVGARTILINREAPSEPNPYFHEVIVGVAEEILPTLLT
ncbi:Sir2 family NAD-dependent protein deacetylase [Acaryochloris marina]|uniref:SIR2 family NAD-dependent protein deacylase n=1 Tax=Acaryochloris marina TaxID=155978 RepID=UPI001BB0942D|nr:Sir2 family NAD-dependent protein deacetylase [Acaryochloris marina]QUY43144.1 NAD-dependent deacylase [Acaryochloris marina S15]